METFRQLDGDEIASDNTKITFSQHCHNCGTAAKVLGNLTTEFNTTGEIVEKARRRPS